MKIEIIGDNISAPTDQVRRLFADLGLPRPQMASRVEGGTTRADPFTVAVGISSLILTLPSVIDATINLIDRARRDTAHRNVDGLKAALEAAGAESIITTAHGRTLILPKAATDDVVDAILTELRELPSEKDPR